MTDDERIADATRRWQTALHGVQSATALQIERLGEKGAGSDAKHNRVGINAAMSDHGALVKLLVDKGVITNVEYLEAIADSMERELEMRSADTRRKCGLPDSVTFG